MSLCRRKSSVRNRSVLLVLFFFYFVSFSSLPLSSHHVGLFTLSRRESKNDLLMPCRRSGPQTPSLHRLVHIPHAPHLPGDPKTCPLSKTHGHLGVREARGGFQYNLLTTNHRSIAMEIRGGPEIIRSRKSFSGCLCGQKEAQ